MQQLNSFRVSSFSENPCVTGRYFELSEPDRAAGYTKECSLKSDVDQLSEEYAWYRFTGKAGTRLATRCVPMHRCGTEAPGWLNGTLPKTKNVGEVNRTVCFHWKHDCCHWKARVKVRNCGHFYLFYLKRKNPLEEKYKYRYCGNGGGKARHRTFERKGDTRNCFPNCKFQIVNLTIKKLRRNIMKSRFSK